MGTLVLNNFRKYVTKRTAMARRFADHVPAVLGRYSLLTLTWYSPAFRPHDRRGRAIS
jgi:hypothetical protein